MLAHPIAHPKGPVGDRSVGGQEHEEDTVDIVGTAIARCPIDRTRQLVCKESTELSSSTAPCHRINGAYLGGSQSWRIHRSDHTGASSCGMSRNTAWCRAQSDCTCWCSRAGGSDAHICYTGSGKAKGEIHLQIAFNSKGHEPVLDKQSHGPEVQMLQQGAGETLHIAQHVEETDSWKGNAKLHNSLRWEMRNARIYTVENNSLFSSTLTWIIVTFRPPCISTKQVNSTENSKSIMLQWTKTMLPTFVRFMQTSNLKANVAEMKNRLA